MNIEKEVKAVITEQLGVEPEEIQSENSFIKDLGADSLDAVEIVLQLEDRFEIDIPDEDAKKITSVSEAVKYIKEKKGLK